MIIHILGGGPIELLPDFSPYADEEIIWVGVDRGVYTLLSLGITPSIAFGDFDSVSEEELILIEKDVTQLKRFKPEKDETDMELAMNWAINQKPSIIRMFGATGGRLDHMFANIQLLIYFMMNKQDIDIEVVDRYNIIATKPPGTYKVERIQDKKYISFIPISNTVKDLTLKGFKYPLTNRHIPLGSTLCISNELISDSGTFSFSKGILMLIRSTD